LGRPPAELVEIRGSVPDFPIELGYLWDWFVSLTYTRQAGFGASPITEQEIHAYCCNRGLRMSRFELEAIRELDRIALTEFKKEGKDGR
jgi:hypothetical protein